MLLVVDSSTHFIWLKPHLTNVTHKSQTYLRNSCQCLLVYLSSQEGLWWLSKIVGQILDEPGMFAAGLTTNQIGYRISGIVIRRFGETTSILGMRSRAPSDKCVGSVYTPPNIS